MGGKRSAITKDMRAKWFLEEAEGLLTAEDMLARAKEQAPGEEIDAKKLDVWRRQWRRENEPRDPGSVIKRTRRGREPRAPIAPQGPQNALVITEEFVDSILRALDSVSSQVEAIRRMLIGA